MSRRRSGGGCPRRSPTRRWACRGSTGKLALLKPRSLPLTTLCSMVTSLSGVPGVELSSPDHRTLDRLGVDGQDALALRALHREPLDRHVRGFDRDPVVRGLTEDRTGRRTREPGGVDGGRLADQGERACDHHIFGVGARTGHHRVTGRCARHRGTYGRELRRRTRGAGGTRVRTR